MAKLSRAVIFFLLLSACAAAAHAQSVPPPSSEAEKAELLNRLIGIHGGPTYRVQRTAYETAKEYLSKYGAPADEAEAQIVRHLRDWVARYEAAVRNFRRPALPPVSAGARPVCRLRGR